MQEKMDLEKQRIKSFEPVVDSRTRVLILGSMPGIASLTKQEYYGHKNNAFWKIIFSIFNHEPILDYQQRLDFLNSNSIGLWDVIASCHRIGSLDSAISQESVNDFEKLFSTYPNIKYVLFNGTKAFETYKKRVGFASLNDNIVFKKMPSTSPAHTSKFELKLQEWKIINQYLAK